MQIEFGGCRGSQHYKPDYFARRLDFRREEGILLMSWFKQDEFRISAFTSIHAAFVASDLRNSPSQCISAQDHSSFSVDNLLTCECRPISGCRLSPPKNTYFSQGGCIYGIGSNFMTGLNCMTKVTDISRLHL